MCGTVTNVTNVTTVAIVGLYTYVCIVHFINFGGLILITVLVP